MNRLFLIGRLGKDPQFYSTADGKAFATFSLATTDGYGDNKKTQWHNVICFGDNAYFARDTLRKGSHVYADGRIESRKYKKRDGTEAFQTQAVIAQIELIESQAPVPEAGDPNDEYPY